MISHRAFPPFLRRVYFVHNVIHKFHYKTIKNASLFPFFPTQQNTVLYNKTERLFLHQNLYTTAQGCVCVEPTPNPEAKKFCIKNSPNERYGVKVFSSLESAAGDPLPLALLKIPGVLRVLTSVYYITIVKEKAYGWPDVEKKVLRFLNDFVKQTGRFFDEDKFEAVPEVYSDDEDDMGDDTHTQNTYENETTEECIQRLINMRVRPLVQSDGGQVDFMKFDRDTGTVWVYMSGACEGCPSSTVTVQRGIKQLLTFFVEEVKDVQQCDENGEPLESDNEDD